MRLLDVDIEANCVCADQHGHIHHQGTINEKYVRVETSTPKVVTSYEKKLIQAQQTPERKASASGVTLTGTVAGAKPTPAPKQI